MNVGRVTVLVGCCLLSTEAAAAPVARLDYQRGAGAESCPDEAALRGAVRDRLGYDPFFDSAEQGIIAKISADGAELRGDVQLLDDAGKLRGRRELRAPTTQCAELVSR